MAEPIVMPRLGDFMTEGVVAKWAKSAGDRVGQGEVIAEIESEKLNYELEAAQTGVLHPVVAEGSTVAVDGLLGYLLAEGEAPPAAASAPAARATQAPAVSAAPGPQVDRQPGEAVPSTPGARRLAANLGVDIAKVTPTGPRGRVVEEDVRAFAAQKPAAHFPQHFAKPTVPAGLPQPSRTETLTGMRKSIADHMRGSIAGTAQLSFFVDVDLTEAERLRKEVSRDRGVALSKTHVFIKACAEALKANPALNTVLADGKVLYFDDVDIGVAVSLDGGLIVPVVRRAQDKTVVQIAQEVEELVARAREGKLLPDQVIGGTFTISVLGSVDGFTPILNRGQTAIMGVGRTVQRPVVVRGEVVVRSMTTISLTVDHQVVDGAASATFLRRFQQAIERPAPLFG